MTNQFGNLLVPLLKNKKKIKINILAAAGIVKRSIFKLPHPSAIRNWTSVVCAEPGFQTEVLGALNALKNEEKDWCLIFDSMSIRQQLLWDER